MKKGGSNLLVFLSGKRGSNPRPLAWEANALPLSYSRIFLNERRQIYTKYLFFSQFRLKKDKGIKPAC
jgi:hypothetical protein